MKKTSILMIITCALVLSLSPNAFGLTLTPTTNANTLVSNILGPGITLVGSPSYTGEPNQSATFTGGNASGVGFDTGILMTSGNVNQVPGPNDNGTETVGSQGAFDYLDDDVSTDLGTSGDTDLTTLAGGSDTFDASVLNFGFQFGDGSIGGNLFFNFVFASEEYVDYIGSVFNDVFGFWVDDINIALVPGTSDPITINNINNSTNSAYYRNNVANTNSILNLGLDLSFDGLTTVITANKLGLGSGVHKMKFAVADTSDHILDAGVFIQGGSFSVNPPPPPIPEPSTLLLVGGGVLCIGVIGRRLRK